MAMTHPYPPICLFREKLPGVFRAHIQGPSHPEAEAWAPVKGAWQSAYLTGCYLAGGQAASHLGRGQRRGQTRLCCLENGVSFLFQPSLVLLLAEMGFGLLDDARTYPGLGQPLAFEDGR